MSYEDAFGDAVYDAWRSGLNPDAVDRDRVWHDVASGYDRYEAAEREVEHLRRSTTDEPTGGEDEPS